MEKRMIIGIAGGSGSGKTTLAENIAAHFGSRVSILRHDDYYRAQRDVPITERARMNYDHPDAFDTDLLLSHLDALARGEDVDSPTYDYTVHDRAATTHRVAATPVIVLEGILIFENAAVRERLDMKIFVDTDADVRILRRLVRDVRERGRSLDSVVSQYLTTVKPMHEAFVEPSKRYADVIIPEGGKNPVANELIIRQIAARLG